MALLTRWDTSKFELGSYNHADVRKYCVQDPDWQEFRKSLKGKSTQIKLTRLQWWWIHNWFDSLERQIRTRCQVTNYLYALKRGGLLDDNLVARERGTMT
jgi:hypothetical protein